MSLDDEYEDAMCPECETILTGAREPGDEDFCQDAQKEVTLVEPS